MKKNLNPDNSISKLAAGHYDLDSLAKKITNLFSKLKYHKLETETNTPFGQLVIKNNDTSRISLKVPITPKYFFRLNKSLHLFKTNCTFLN